MEFVTLLAQTLLVAAQAVWLGIGAFENLRIPKANGDMVADVLSLRQLKIEAPDIHAACETHRIDNPFIQRLLFAGIVIGESVAALILIVGTFALLGALLGFWAAETPRIIAALGVLGFTMVWGSFLAVGQWFHYWAAYQNAQHTHFMLAIWGTVTLALLL
ncbi:DUF2165 family protein [Kaistia dalseonensis]|uniref:Small integral membrane protein n=1 Tax=Kaistia dalseonensis TaxID=410840 RepID=A0ABU0H772_9HYPH|nr:DUF2165 family protein [Kaistia dalseonensis]MCX5495567.1 DUF2165 family protein [Kaistia dalseonensis]MDQ0438159.1 putative small integral membrane protein [Kaistia dalseonensis]